MRDSSFSKSNAGRSGASGGFRGLFRRNCGASMSKNTQSQKHSFSASSQAGNAIGGASSNLSTATNANSQQMAAMQPLSANNSKRRSTFGSRLSVHSLFFPSAYSTPVGATNANSNLTNVVFTSTTKSYSKETVNRSD